MSFDPPKSRNEAILQNMLGANNVLPSPKGRIEELLLQILQQGGSGGGSITVDDALSDTSTNPVQNRVITNAIKPFEIHIISDGNGGYATQETAAEIIAHAENCVVVFAGRSIRTSAQSKTENSAAVLVSFTPDESTIVSFDIEANGNTVSVEFYATNLIELPAVTASDNGKFLRVVNGAWAAQTVPAAESNSFGGGS